ncbi:deoxyribose-phosphate aldolase [Micrococcoides hystricis]|uniref:Deoxyribose-phosphate aldolase n=1 Tax=Micrococcoides hystricis TaxID=1572761 RepID=A0ABV6PAC6_9MICC
MTQTARSIAPLIDHTLLAATANSAAIDQLCQEADKYGFASVCVNPVWVPRAVQNLSESQVKVCTVIGFPLGALPPSLKAAEARWAIEQGADEIDMVINVAAAIAGDEATVHEDIVAVVAAARVTARSKRVVVKVIIETALLEHDAKILACSAAKAAGADFVKTSTGFSTAGATVEDVALMRATVGEQMGVKASGGIRDRATAEAMIEAGATRLGASAGVQICSGAEEAGATGY